ncbi:MAG TPA: helix-turn-helix transcriptional regulator [Burkholderiaceae bacterium]
MAGPVITATLATAAKPAAPASFTARSHLMAQLTDLIRLQGWTQTQAAARLGVTQPRISDLTRGKIDLFSLDTLMDMAAVAGLQPRISLTPTAN